METRAPFNTNFLTTWNLTCVMETWYELFSKAFMKHFSKRNFNFQKLEILFSKIFFQKKLLHACLSLFFNRVLEKLYVKTTGSWWRLNHLYAGPSSLSQPHFLQGHMIKRSCDIIGRSPSSEVIILPSFVAISTGIVEI